MATTTLAATIDADGHIIANPLAIVGLLDIIGTDTVVLPDYPASRYHSDARA